MKEKILKAYEEMAESYNAMIEIRRYVTAQGKDVFQGWLDKLRDIGTRANRPADGDR